MSYTPGPPDDDDFMVLSQEALEELLGAIDAAQANQDRQQLKTLAGWRWPFLRCYLAMEGLASWPCRRLKQWFDWWIWPHQRGPK